MIANSRAGADYAHTERGFRPQRLEVVANGIDTEKFQPMPQNGRWVREKLRVNENEILVGIVGRIDPMKGHDVFLHAARLISQCRGDCRFVVVGGGCRDRIEHLKKLTHKLGLEERVLWPGSRNDMPAVYTALDILVSSSSYGEGFPNVVGEAMACGTPCVVTDVGDSAMIVGNLGRVVPAGDSESLAHEVVTFEKWGAKLSPEALRERIERYFSISLLCEETDRLLQEVNRGW
jgi:glycosyltransferase involved in cell wall biosynthesis